MRHRYYFYHQVAKSMIIFFSLYFIYLYFAFSTNKEVHKIRHKANQLPLYQCPPTRTIFPQKLYAKRSLKPAPIEVYRRILLITQLNSNHPHKLIASFLGHLKVLLRVETLNKDFPLLELASTGRFSLIVFEDYQVYHELSNSSKSLLHNYCAIHNVGLISFLSLQNDEEEKDFGMFTAKGGQLAHNIAFAEQSPIRRVGKVTPKLPYAEAYLPEWTLFHTKSHGGTTAPVLEAEDVYGTPLAAAILSLHGTQHVIFGHTLHHWIIKIAFLDALIYMAPNIVEDDLERFLQIDIDDVFVGQTGSRFIPDDVRNLKETQQDLRKYIHNFSFALGFSGYFFRHGDSLEIQGDERIVAESDEFLWFPHMWRHNHAHEYTQDYLVALMAQNRQFAENMKLKPLPGYAISPQHSGVYPIYQPLYKAWSGVWGVKVTSTEEYPHLRPAAARKAFVHGNVSVLPRQTCGLFTHTSFFHSYPEGIDNLYSNIFGGDLFLSVLMNKFSIFMTHQQNFANDRLGSFTFQNLVRFVDCWTNLKLRWTTPVDLAQRYFTKFPTEKKMFYTNPCSDVRHKKMLPENYNCSQLVLPNVVILGPQKTGTSALSLFLSLHPNVSTNSPVEGSFEELQFFGGNNYPQGLDWYVDKFSNSSSAVIFEKSANYFDSEQAPVAVQALLPTAKLVVIMMNPVDRAYSWFQHISAHNESLPGNLTAEQVFMSNISAAARLRKRCLGPGLYAQHLDRWLDHFPPSQLILVDGHQLRYEPENAVKQLFGQLNLPHRDLIQRLKFVPEKGFYCVLKDDRKLKCLGQSKGRRYSPMSSALRDYLSNYYREHNSALFQMLNRYNLPIPSFLFSFSSNRTY